MNYPDREEIQSWLELSDQELLTMIGKEVFTFVVLPGERPPKRWEIALRFFDRFETDFYGRLCIQRNICKKMGEPGFGDDISLVLAVGDMIAGLITGIPPFQVAAFLVKNGIKQFCHCGRELDSEKKKRYIEVAGWEIDFLNKGLAWLKEEPDKNKELISSTKERLNVFMDLRRSLLPKKKRKN